MGGRVVKGRGNVEKEGERVMKVGGERGGGEGTVKGRLRERKVRTEERTRTCRS